MVSFFSNIFGRKKDYAEQKKALKSADVKERLSLAKSKDTKQEVLYYLALNDPDQQVREAVVQNKNLPAQVVPKIAEDKNEAIRLILAHRLCRLLPEISEDKQSKLYAHVVQAMATLALDEVLKIRKALSSALKDSAHAPPSVVRQLARDIEREVAEPILRYCVSLSDQDIVEILKEHPDDWAVQAVAERYEVEEIVSHAVIETGSRPGGQSLLTNKKAKISLDTLQLIIEKAKEFEEWQEPLAVRKRLPKSILVALAEFASRTVQDILQGRDDFDDETKKEIQAVFKRRLEFDNESVEETSENTVDKVTEMYQKGTLDDDAIADAIGMRNKEFVYHAISVKADTNYKLVDKVFDMKAAKPLVALCWKAGLSMRTALLLQKNMGQIQPKDLLYPRGGTDYPMDEEEIQWQLEFIGLKKNDE